MVSTGDKRAAKLHAHGQDSEYTRFSALHRVTRHTRVFFYFAVSLRDFLQSTCVTQDFKITGIVKPSWIRIII